MGLAAFVLIVIGIAVCQWGWRGRRVDGCELCAACSFDLSGTLRAAAQGHVERPTCSECGANLRQAGAIVRARRERRPVAMWAGVAVAAFGGALFAWLATLQAAGAKAVQLQPYWILRGAAQGANADATAAQEELMRRITAGELSKAKVRELVDISLLRQSQSDEPWGAWGDLFEAADSVGAVAAAQRQAFLEGMLVFQLRARPKIASGDPLPFDVLSEWRGVGRSSARFPPSWAPGQSITLEFESVTLDGLPVVPPSGWRGGSGGGSSHTWCTSWQSKSPSPFAAVEAKPGHHMLRARLRISCQTVGVLPPHRESLVAEGLNPDWTVSVEAPVEVLPRGTPTVTVVQDEATLQQFAARAQAWFTASESLVLHSSGSPQLPRNVAFDVFLDMGPRRVRIGQCYSLGWMLMGPDAKDADEALRANMTQGTSARLVLVPSSEAAKQTVDIVEIAGGTEAIVPVIRQ